VQTKLTLRLDDRLIRHAKSIARQRGKSVSQMVADYFRLLGSPSSKGRDDVSPTVRSPHGVMKGAKLDREDYRRHLEEKFL